MYVAQRSLHGQYLSRDNVNNKVGSKVWLWQSTLAVVFVFGIRLDLFGKPATFTEPWPHVGIGSAVSLRIP